MMAITKDEQAKRFTRIKVLFGEMADLDEEISNVKEMLKGLKERRESKVIAARDLALDPQGKLDLETDD
jgi:hypothetical protein